MKKNRGRKDPASTSDKFRRCSLCDFQAITSGLPVREFYEDEHGDDVCEECHTIITEALYELEEETDVLDDQDIRDTILEDSSTL